MILTDVAAAFHQAGAEQDARKLLYCWDSTHLGRQGHALTAETVFKAITSVPP